MPRVTDEHKERRREAILEAALAVFLGKGYQLATVDDIATRAQISVGAIYRYFTTKSEIMLTLLEQRMGRTPELFARLIGDQGTPWERLVRCIDLFIMALRVKHPATGRLLLVAWGEALQDGIVRQGLQNRFKALADYLAGIITDGINRGYFRADIDAAAVAANLLCTADGVTIYWVIAAPGVDLRPMRTALLTMLKALLADQETAET